MIVVQAPVAQKVDNSFSWIALSSQLFSRYPADKVVHSKVGCVKKYNFYLLNKPVAK